jgi:hypothetical protein
MQPRERLYRSFCRPSLDRQLSRGYRGYGFVPRIGQGQPVILTAIFASSG